MRSPEYSAEERSWLLQLAHEAILSSLEHRVFTPEPLNSHLTELRGAFTTLYLRDRLRGCVGFIAPATPLYRTVVESARSAALDDARFEPVNLKEAHLLQIEISVLSPLRPIQPEEVKVGEHGLLISQGAHRGLLLPQVAVEHGWDRVTFLEQTCRKAGLPADAWLSAELEAFTAEVFGDGAQSA